MITAPVTANLAPFHSRNGGLGVLWADGEPLDGEQKVVVVPLEHWELIQVHFAESQRLTENVLDLGKVFGLVP